MKQYKVINGVTLNDGLVLLSEDQYKRRMFAKCLEKIKDDVYRIVSQVYFKRGEVISYEGELSRGVADCLECLDNESDEMTRAEIMLILDMKGINYDKRAKKEVLLDLLGEEE